MKDHSSTTELDLTTIKLNPHMSACMKDLKVQNKFNPNSYAHIFKPEKTEHILGLILLALQVLRKKCRHNIVVFQLCSTLR